MIVPLLEKYDFHATFNRISYGVSLSEEDRNLVNILLNKGHEIGDHTWMHYGYIYSMPLSNGQNPDSPDGDQEAYPSNADMRNDRGDGKNAFGFDVNEKLSVTYGYDSQYLSFDNKWGNLTDEQCQALRNSFSVIRDESLIDTLDLLSNRYLNTTGSSIGSWDDNLGVYTGGIFSGCKTSANHEIWDRLAEATCKYYLDIFNISLKTWSWPGSKGGRFIFERNGMFYYDRECTKYANYNMKFKSSRTGEERSWTDVLRNNGYTVTHDYIFPGRSDARVVDTQICIQMIHNSSLFRPDAVLYPTNRTIDSLEMQEGYPETFFVDNANYADQMYEQGRTFYHTVETIRRETANGIIHGEVIDSVSSFSERIFLDGLMHYCKDAGIEWITKAKAFEVCFDDTIPDGNLIYNPNLENTAKKFFKNAKNVPSNPDGYQGNCYVTSYDGVDELCTVTSTIYRHYGVPYGELVFAVEAKGSGSIQFYLIRNNTPLQEDIESMEGVGLININSEGYQAYNTELFIPNEELSDYTDIYEGYENKVIGLFIWYSSGLKVKNIDLHMKSH